MKSFFLMFPESIRECRSIRTLTITGMFIALSMALEMFSIDIAFAKVNFAFLAIAAIGMLFGPSTAFLAGLMCDIVGFIAHPTGGFLPAYVLVAGLQGLIYGACLYHKAGKPIMLKNSFQGKKFDAMFAARLILARLLDVVIINLLLNTALNMHYGFIPKEAFHLAVAGRLIKNLVELAADIPLLLILMPACLLIYRRATGNVRAA